MKLPFTILFLCCLTSGSPAQEILIGGKPDNAKQLTSFYFKQYNGGVVTISGTLNNRKDSLRFILDTGSGGISLDSTTCADLGLSVASSDTIITGLGGTHKVNFVHDVNLNLPGLTVEHLDFHINDYDILSSVYGEKIDGIIGYSVLSKYIVALNYDDNTITFYTPGFIKYPRGSTLLKPTFTNLPIETLHIKDGRKVDFNFYFDTGAGLCLLLSENFIQDSNFLHKKRRPVITQAEGMGGKLQMRLSVTKMLQIGPYKFRNVPTYLYKDDYNVTSYPFTGGLIGNDLLRRFNVILNYPHKEISIIPNKHYVEPFDYAYSGMAIYYSSGAITVEDIIAGSPADKAGLKVGDIIIGVSNNFSNNIQLYKTLLQNVNQKTHLIVSRAGQLEDIIIKPISILK